MLYKSTLSCSVILNSYSAFLFKYSNTQLFLENKLKYLVKYSHLSRFYAHYIVSKVKVVTKQDNVTKR